MSFSVDACRPSWFLLRHNKGSMGLPMLGNLKVQLRATALGGDLRMIHGGAIVLCLWYANVHSATQLPLSSAVKAGALYRISHEVRW